MLGITVSVSDVCCCHCLNVIILISLYEKQLLFWILFFHCNFIVEEVKFEIFSKHSILNLLEMDVLVCDCTFTLRMSKRLQSLQRRFQLDDYVNNYSHVLFFLSKCGFVIMSLVEFFISMFTHHALLQ